MMFTHCLVRGLDGEKILKLVISERILWMHKKLKYLPFLCSDNPARVIPYPRLLNAVKKRMSGMAIWSRELMVYLKIVLDRYDL